MSFYAIIDNDDPTGNPVLEVSGDGWDRAPYSSTMEREMTPEEMLEMANQLMNKVGEILAARENAPGWEKRSYSVG